jgi:hypothetical protein
MPFDICFGCGAGGAMWWGRVDIGKGIVTGIWGVENKVANAKK